MCNITRRYNAVILRITGDYAYFWDDCESNEYILGVRLHWSYPHAPYKAVMKVFSDWSCTLG